MFSKKSVSYISENGTLIFWEMELSWSKIKELQEKTFQARKIKKFTSKKFLIFHEIEFFSPKLKELLSFF